MKVRLSSGIDPERVPSVSSNAPRRVTLRLVAATSGTVAEKLPLRSTVTAGAEMPAAPDVRCASTVAGPLRRTNTAISPAPELNVPR